MTPVTSAAAVVAAPPCRSEKSNGMVSTSEQLSQLGFCSAVFNEAIRLKSVAPFLMYYCKVR